MLHYWKFSFLSNSVENTSCLFNLPTVIIMGYEAVPLLFANDLISNPHLLSLTLLSCHLFKCVYLSAPTLIYQVPVHGFSFNNSDSLSWAYCDSSKPGRACVPPNRYMSSFFVHIHCSVSYNFVQYIFFVYIQTILGIAFNNRICFQGNRYYWSTETFRGCTC